MDNDQQGENCVVDNYGPSAGVWWYNACSAIQLNHVYKHDDMMYINGKYYALSFTEIKIRPKNCII